MKGVHQADLAKQMGISLCRLDYYRKHHGFPKPTLKSTTSREKLFDPMVVWSWLERNPNHINLRQYRRPR